MSGDSKIIDSDAPSGGGGAGHFKGARIPQPAGLAAPGKDACYLGPSAGYMDPKHCHKPEPGTREEIFDKEAGIHLLVEVMEDGLFHWIFETLDGDQSCEGVYNPAKKPGGKAFVGEICIDITREGIRKSDMEKALDKEIEIVKKKRKKTTVTKSKKKSKPVESREVIVIVKRDWLSKISYARWKTFDWARYLKPTQETLDDPRRQGVGFDPDLIYPDDTFLVISQKEEKS